MTMLDVKDRKLLEIYTDNAKLPIRQLAKMIGVSREVAQYRIKRLKQKGIVKRVVAKIDMTRFYQNAYAMFLRFSKLDEQFLKEAIEFFAANPYIMWVSALSGEYDIGTSFLTRTPNDLGLFMQTMERQFGKNLKEYDLFPYEAEYKNTFRGAFLTKTATLSEALIKDFTPQKLIAELDDKDRTILYALSKDAELTNAQLGGLVELSEEAVRLRIKNYEKTGIIKGYRGLVDLTRLGLSLYYIFLRFDNMSTAQEKTFETYVHMNPHIYYCAKIIGKYNVQASVWANSPTHFQAILADIRNTFTENLSSFRSQLMFAENQNTYFPPAAILGQADVKKVDDYFAYRHMLP